MAFRIGLANGVMNRGVRGVLVSGVTRGEGVTEGEGRWEGGAEIGGVAGATFVGVTWIHTSSPTSSMTHRSHRHTLLYQFLWAKYVPLHLYI